MDPSLVSVWFFFFLLSFLIPLLCILLGGGSSRAVWPRFPAAIADYPGLCPS